MLFSSCNRVEDKLLDEFNRRDFVTKQKSTTGDGVVEKIRSVIGRIRWLSSHRHPTKPNTDEPVSRVAEMKSLSELVDRI